MKPYLEIKELHAHYFICYFSYSKVKYGSREHSPERLGRVSAYKSIMNLYGRYIRVGQRIKRELLLKDFDYLHKQILALPDDGFRKAFLSVFEELDLHHC